MARLAACCTSGGAVKSDVQKIIGRSATSALMRAAAFTPAT
jgi:hypothetical protein